MKFLTSKTIETRACQLLEAWSEANNERYSIPIDVSSLAQDYLGLMIQRRRLPAGVIAELRPREELIYLDVGQNVHAHRSRFSIAHEIGHAILHTELGHQVLCRTSQDTSRLEIQANSFAAALLAPASDLLAHLAQMLDCPPKFTRMALRGDREATADWLSTLLRVHKSQEKLLRTLAHDFRISTEAMTLRLHSLRIRRQ